MKTLLFFLVCSTLTTFAAEAATSRNFDKKFRYCDGITDVDKLLDRSRESVERIKAEGLHVERILVSKDRRQMYLISGDVVVRTFAVAFGFNSVGHKQVEGDGKTPEGLYFIDYKNPQSAYSQALHISYPNKEDIERARSLGKSPGGDIMIHGFPRDPEKRAEMINKHPGNWTEGCVAVTNEEMAEIYTLIRERTLVEICKVSEGVDPG